MYEQFGAIVDHRKKTVTFRLFFPDHSLDNTQYFTEYHIRDGNGNILHTNHASGPDIGEVRIVGDFQQKLGGRDWDFDSAPRMNPPVPFPAAPDKPKGVLYEAGPFRLGDGFFQYKYSVVYNGDSASRLVNDPCTKYHNFHDGDNSGFVIGGNAPIRVKPLSNRLPLKDLIIYELHPDDFTAEFRHTSSPLQAIRAKVDYIKSLGVNAVELMPWTATPNGGFNWGYMNFLYFSVTNRYTDDKLYPLEKISQLKSLIDLLHKKDIHVIMDGVFNHTADEFPYHQLYKEKELSPFIGNYGEVAFGPDLDYNNLCTQEFVFDVCRYWIEVFKIDGFRFDYTKGFFNGSGAGAHGLARLISDLKQYIASDPSLGNFSLVMEQLNGYQSVDDTNRADADGCWFDEFYWKMEGSVRHNGRIGREIMRVLDANYQFAPGKVPVIYTCNHDHKTFVNSIGIGYYSRSLWWKTQPYQIALYTSPGAILFYSGAEWGENIWIPEGSEEGPSKISRVVHRAVHWTHLDDDAGKSLYDLHRKLIAIRNRIPALRSANFYPSQEYSTVFNSKGYGFHEEKQVVIYHRWADDEKVIVVLNFSNTDQVVSLPFSGNGTWQDVLNDRQYRVTDCRINDFIVNPNWGNIFYCKG